jgi:hypothetical protein
MDFKKYIAETERSYNYRLRTICLLDDNAMDKIERIAMKYQPLDISRPRKTMMQKNPLDFQNVEHGEVWIVDFEFGLPASGYMFGEEIRHALACPENHVIVRGSNDPTEVETERLVASEEMGKEAADRGLSPSGLLNDPHYSEVTPAEDLYGKAHNEKFLGYLRTVQKEREAKSKIDAPNAKFKWLDLPKNDVKEDDGAYNADIPDAPKVGKAGEKVDPTDVAREGNLDDRKRTYKRQYGKEGTLTMLTNKVDTTKDPK